MVHEINSMKTTWHADIPVRFANATVADVKRQLGSNYYLTVQDVFNHQ